MKFAIATGAVTVQNPGAANNALTLTGLRSTDGGDIVLQAGSAASSGLLLSVGAGERTDYTVPPGTFGGSCSAHPAKKRLTFVIQ